MQKFIADAKEIAVMLKEEILQNIVTTKIPTALIKKYPGCSNQEIVNSLSKLACCEILRHTITWPLATTKIQQVVKTNLVDIAVDSSLKQCSKC